MYPELPANHEAIVGNAYYGAFALICICELVISRRPLVMPMRSRWSVNLGLAVINSIAIRALFPVLGVSLAISVAEKGIGLFNTVNAPTIVAIVTSLLALDFLDYALHWLEHRVPVLWRLHLVHHCDVDVDLTTELRHHPGEAILSSTMLLAVVAIFGAPPFAIFLFMLLQSISGLWQHSNTRIPTTLDRIVRWVFVTPDMHRIHHSICRSETDSNYTNLFSFWDRLFGTYRAAPIGGHDNMTLGLPYFRERTEQRLDRILLHPFRRLTNSTG